MKVLRCIGASILLLSATLVTSASGQTGGRTAVGAGGGRSGDGAVSMCATVGQSAVGAVMTPGRFLQQGFWHTASGSVTATAAEEPTTGQRTFRASVWPNPSAGEATLTVDIPVSGHVSATMYDMHGRAVRALLDGTYAAGKMDIPLDGSELPSGAYTIALVSGVQRTTITFSLVR